jgi:predicted metal-dependent hydrolase
MNGSRASTQVESGTGGASLPAVARYAPDVPLPPYTYVTGRTPHPIRDPQGHLFGRAAEAPPPLDPQRWRENVAYLLGIDLFNHGYYWEAHEVWEGLWHAAERTGPVADFLKGLIKLAAAGVKAYEGRPDGVCRHAARAQQLFETVRATADAPDEWAGPSLANLITLSLRLQAEPPRWNGAALPEASLIGTLQPT